MTEKRFTLVKCYNEQWGVVDNSLEEIDQLVLITTSKSGTAYLVSELNELNEENEQLKQYKQAVSDVLLSYSQKNLSAKQLGLLTAIMHELGVLE